MPLIRSGPDKAPAPPTGDEGLSSPSADIRWAAARGATDHPDAVAALAQALAREDDARVREAIFTALARIGSADSVAAVLPYLRSDDANRRTAALDALRAMPGLTASHLQGMLSDPDSDVRLLSCELLRAVRVPDAPGLLRGLIETDVEANVCAAAIEVLAEIGDADAVPSLVRCGARFPDDPFLAFAIKAATERLSVNAKRE